MKFEIGKATLLAGCVVALGCSAAVDPAPKAGSTYHLQAVDDLADPSAVIGNLPASISVADAKRLLVSVDPAQIQAGGAYTLQAHRGHFNGHRRVSRDRSFFSNRLFANSFLLNRSLVGYYGAGSYLFPYYLNNGIYSPYASNCMTPYLVRASAYLYPYTYAGLDTRTGATTPCYDALGAPGPGLILNNI